MSYAYKKILPEEVFITVFDRPATEEELWQGLPTDFKGNRPTENDFINQFADLLHQYQFAEINFYAGLMEIPPLFFSHAIQALSGIKALDWRNRYVMLSACELLEKTDMEIGEIAIRLNFTNPSVFSKFFRQHHKMQPYQWRTYKRGGNIRTYHYYE